MAGDIRGFALDKVEIISSCLRDLLSSGEGYVRTHLGVELGLRAEQLPPWVMLLSAVVGLLVLMVPCAAVCGGLLGGKKKRSVNITSKENVEPHKDLTKNSAAPEELRRKNKKKLTEKKTPSNGQPVSISHGCQENVKVSPKTKVEKLQSTSSEVLSVQIPTHVKKNKKKPKPEARPTQQTSTPEEKQDDGAWETKVSNREKRQQRKKERGSDVSGSPGGLVAPRAPVEGPGVKTTKKNKKHGSLLSKPPGKVGVGAATTWSEEALNNTAGWIDMSLKVSSKRGPMEGPKWSGLSATQPWTQETQAWSGIEGRMKNDLNPVSFSMLAPSPAEPAASSIEQWTNQVPEDDWSGFNGITTDPTSDWNAPLEHWGNYEEPPPVEPPAFALKEQPGIIKLSEDEKDSDPSEGAAKSKKRRRKKKKTEEESGSASQMVSSVFKQELSVQSSHKPSTLPAQKKPEETAEPLKFVQKKKVRRET
ncbi:unnamed protein product [Knipowitschia caucasica]|uniref:Protein LYRIC n=1 Tax=Knipowitschia caucasica TaxID=637954 RepID=A0AAV2KB92_KNICA